MGEKIVVGPFPTGLKNDVLPFNLDNTSFPVLVNAYQWRGRIKRKRGTAFLTRFMRAILNRTIVNLDAGGAGMTFLLSSGIFIPASQEPTSYVVPGSINFTDGTNVWTEPSPPNGTLLINGVAGGGTINYASGRIDLAGGLSLGVVTGTFRYYPGLPVMGLEDISLNNNQFTGTIGFDTTYAYNIQTFFPNLSYNISYYKNPAASASLPGYVPKTAWTPLNWNGQNYQQFYTTNYENAFWATNGINVPFNVTNIGMQFAPSATITYISNTATTIVLNITGSPLVIGDFVYFNEWSVGGVSSQALNFQTGYVTAIAGTQYTFTLPNANLPVAVYVPGIVQYLTNNSDSTKDCIRWYDGDPTDGNATNPGFTTGRGWVNFMPPLSAQNLSIADLPARQYYLAGARLIVKFKDRLLFMGVVVQASTGVPIYLPDTVVYSQNGTPYYTSSFSGDPLLANTQFFSILVPPDQTATAPAWFGDTPGFGGWISPGLQQPIINVESSQDVLIVGLSTIETRLVYSGNDLRPFDFFLIDTEMGTTSTFSSINMGTGVLSKGSRGYIYTTQVSNERFDEGIPDEVFQLKITNNGSERVTAARDFINEWVYMTYVGENTNNVFPSETLQYNYRDKSWAKFRESYTTYGLFREITGLVWANVGRTYPTWSSWNKSWNAGASTSLKPVVIAGNQQGYVVYRDKGTDESPSLSIKSISASTITSPNHCLNSGDFIVIDGCIGTISALLNNRIFRVDRVTLTTFTIDPNIGTGTYLGGGYVKRIYNPFIQTKQFQNSWALARKTRIGVQQYLLTKTAQGQITLSIYLSQNDSFSYTFGPIVPEPQPVNSSLIYSTRLHTCPERTNLGLTPANVNLQTPTALAQGQIWHRKNTSLKGDTVQLGFTMTEEQLRALYPYNSPLIITDISQSYPMVVTVANFINPLQSELFIFQNVVGMTELNGNFYNMITSSPTTITLDVDSSSFTAYESGGTMQQVGMFNQFAEIELHGFIIDCTPSEFLA